MRITRPSLARDAAGREVILRVTQLFFEAVKAQEDLDVAVEILESMQGTEPPGPRTGEQGHGRTSGAEDSGD